MGVLCMLAVLAAWTAIAFVYRLAERRRADRMVMVSALSAVCLAGNFLVARVAGVNPAQAAPRQLLLGVASGLVSAISLPAFMGAVARGELSITWTALALSFVPASLATVVYPGARLTGVGGMGLVLAAAAVIALGLDMRGRQSAPSAGRPRAGWAVLMTIAFLGNAGVMYAQTLSGRWSVGHGAAADRAGYLVVSSAVMTAAALLMRRGGWGGGDFRRGLAIGILGGVIMLAGINCALLALGPGGISPPVFCAVTTGGSNVFVAALSVVLLGERPGRFGWAGIGLGTLALALFGFAL